MMFSGGTPAWITWIGANTYPPPGASSSMQTVRFVAHLLGRSKRQHGLSITTAAPDGQVGPKLPLEAFCIIHPLAVDLPGIEDVNAGLDQERDEIPDRSVAMEVDEDLGSGPGS